MEKPLARQTVVSIVLLTLLAFTLRWVGLGAMLPQLPEPDNCYVTQVRLLSDESPQAQLHRDYAKYPHLIARVLQLWPAARPAQAGDSIEQHLELASQDSLRPRKLIALLATLLVPATFLIALRFMQPGWALFAAALAATSLLHLDFSQQGRPHAAAAAFATLAVVAALRVQRRGSLRDSLWAGLACALALGTLQSGVAVLIPLAAAHAFNATNALGARLRRLSASLFVVALGIFAFYPFLFDRAQTADPRLAVEEGGVQQGYHTVNFADFNGRGFLTVWHTLWSFEPVLLCASALALALLLHACLRRRLSGSSTRAELFVVLAYALPYLFVIGMYERTFERFVLPLIPYCACLAAWGMSRVFGSLADRPRLALACASLVLALPTFVAARLSWLHQRQDSTELAAQWLSEELQPEAGRMLLMPRLDLPLFRSQRELDEGGVELAKPWVYPWVHYQLGLAPDRWTGQRYRMGPLPMYTGTFWNDLRGDPALALQALDVAYVLFGTWSDGRETQQGLRILEGLGQVGERVARFAPFEDHDGVGRPLWFQETESTSTPFFLAVLRAKFCGPAIEIFRLKRDG